MRGERIHNRKENKKKKTVHCTKACLINANSFFSHPVEGTAKVVDYQVSYPIISSAYKNKDGHSSALVCDHFWDAPDKIYNLKIFSVTLVGACYLINSTRFAARNQPQLQIESQLVLLVFLADWIFHQIVHKPTQCTVVADRSTSCLVARKEIFRLLMKGKFDIYCDLFGKS